MAHAFKVTVLEIYTHTHTPTSCSPPNFQGVESYICKLMFVGRWFELGKGREIEEGKEKKSRRGWGSPVSQEEVVFISDLL